ncbi:MAG: MASE1 domain-containing protein, partial [Gemmatimonadota bacterium]
SQVSHIAFGSQHDWPVEPRPYAVFPFLLWAALRFGPVGATTASVIVAAYSTWNAALGVGPFAAPLGSGADVAL